MSARNSPDCCPRSMIRRIASIGFTSSPIRDCTSGLRAISRTTTRTTSGWCSHVRRRIAVTCRSCSRAGSPDASTASIRSTRTLQFSRKTASSTSSFDEK